MTENFQAFLKLDTSKLANQYAVIINKKVFATGQDIEKMLKKARNTTPVKYPLRLKSLIKNYWYYD